MRDFKESEKFIEKSNVKDLFNHKEVWIKIYKKLLKTPSINKDTDYKKWVKILARHHQHPSHSYDIIISYAL